jgi:hypothetical protein
MPLAQPSRLGWARGACGRPGSVPWCTISAALAPPGSEAQLPRAWRCRYGYKLVRIRDLGGHRVRIRPSMTKTARQKNRRAVMRGGDCVACVIPKTGGLTSTISSCYGRPDQLAASEPAAITVRIWCAQAAEVKSGPTCSTRMRSLIALPVLR